jgi:aspartate beta-hydroxylase
VLLAGLLHSGYSTEAFAFRLFGRRDRPRVRELIGESAERLVFAFGGCGLDALLRAAQEADGAGLPVQLVTRWSGATVQLSRRDLAELLVIHAANLAEQVCRPRGGPARWLAAASRLIAAARQGLEIAPPVFGGGSVQVTPDEETTLLRAYRSQLLRRAPDREGSDVPAWSPVGEPFVVAGLAALAAGRGPEAAALGRQAQAAFDAWGVPWDKRLGLRRWRQLSDLLVREESARDRELEATARLAQVVLDGARGSPERIWAQLDAVHAFAVTVPAPAAVTAPRTPGEGALPPRFVQYLGGLRTNTERHILEFYPGLRVRPWYDPRELAIVADLERHAPAIAAELRAFDTDFFQDEAEDIGRSGRWGVLFLLEMGRRNEENLARCPTTAKILDEHPEVAGRGGAVYFSCLDPRTRLAPHQGPTNLRLRCHLGIEVPDGCGIRVGGVTGSWQEGRCIVFDDSFWHEAWNNGDRRRVVLVLDVWHPDLSDDEVALLSGLQRYGAANGSSAERAWARNDAALKRARDLAALAAKAGRRAPTIPGLLDRHRGS